MSEADNTSNSEQDKSPNDSTVNLNDAVKDPKLVGDLDTAISFLTVLRPQGPWVLTAIIPDGDHDDPDLRRYRRSGRAQVRRDLQRRQEHLLHWELVRTA